MRRRTSGGFTYLGLIILLAVMALVAAAGLKMGTVLQRVAAEEELLEIGAQFSEALRSYAAATPQGQPQQPPSLKELLKDPRFPNPRRHLRKIFVDPITGKAEWGIMYLADKVGVIGVYSLSDARPFKVANFDIRFPNMDNRQRISEWKFLMAGGEGVNPAVQTAPNSMTAPVSLFGNAPSASGELKPGGGAPMPGNQPSDPAAPPVRPPAPPEDAVVDEPPAEETPPAPPPTGDEPAADTPEQPTEGDPPALVPVPNVSQPLPSPEPSLQPHRR